MSASKGKPTDAEEDVIKAAMRFARSAPYQSGDGVYGVSWKLLEELRVSIEALRKERHS